MQRRIVQCVGGDVVVSPSLCNAQERPPHRQECYNDKCKGVWRTDHWSEVCVDLSVFIMCKKKLINKFFNQYLFALFDLKI